MLTFASRKRRTAATVPVIGASSFTKDRQYRCLPFGALLPARPTGPAARKYRQARASHYVIDEKSFYKTIEAGDSLFVSAPSCPAWRNSISESALSRASGIQLTTTPDSLEFFISGYAPTAQ